MFKVKYEAKLEFPEGWGVQTKKPSVGEVWIFSEKTHYALTIFFLYNTTVDMIFCFLIGIS